jgi:CheY-like chemotaxis protein
VLKDKKLLVVDDEPDVLETIVEILEKCSLETAGTYREAERLLKSNTYDMVILDIMGVKGLELLDLAVQRSMPAAMLTGPALSPEYLLEAARRGTVAYFPKDDLVNLDSLMSEVFELLGAGSHPLEQSVQRLLPLLEERFGSDWKSEYSELLDTIKSKHD